MNALRRSVRDREFQIVKDPADWTVGTHLEAYDVRQLWCEAVVLAESGEGYSRKLYVHYVGWSARWDEWLFVHGGQLRPLSGPIRCLPPVARRRARPPPSCPSVRLIHRDPQSLESDSPRQEHLSIGVISGRVRTPTSSGSYCFCDKADTRDPQAEHGRPPIQAELTSCPTQPDGYDCCGTWGCILEDRHTGLHIIPTCTARRRRSASDAGLPMHAPRSRRPRTESAANASSAQSAALLAPDASASITGSALFVPALRPSHIGPEVSESFSRVLTHRPVHALSMPAAGTTTAVEVGIAAVPSSTVIPTPVHPTGLSGTMSGPTRAPWLHGSAGGQASPYDACSVLAAPVEGDLPYDSVMSALGLRMRAPPAAAAHMGRLCAKMRLSHPLREPLLTDEGGVDAPSGCTSEEDAGGEDLEDGDGDHSEQSTSVDGRAAHDEDEASLRLGGPPALPPLILQPSSRGSSPLFSRCDSHCSNCSHPSSRSSPSLSSVLHSRQLVRPPTLKSPTVLITACSYANVAGLVRPLVEVPAEARAIQDAFPSHATTRLDDPSVDALAAALPGHNTWFFLGHGDAMVRGERMPLFVGDNGRCANGLQAISHEALVSTLAAALPSRSNAHLRLVVLNGCKTLPLADAILRRCTSVQHVVCWQSSSHSGAAAVFGSSLARGLAESGARPRGVRRAFEGAKAAVLRQLEPGRLTGGAPVGLPKYVFEDPEDLVKVHARCPCSPRCGHGFVCPLVGRLITPGRATHRQLPPMAAGLPCFLSREVDSEGMAAAERGNGVRGRFEAR